MKDVLMEMVKDRVDEKVQMASQEASQETKVIDIKKMMNNLKLTLEQAMDALEIPAKDRATYTVLVKKKPK